MLSECGMKNAFDNVLTYCEKNRTENTVYALCYGHVAISSLKNNNFDHSEDEKHKILYNEENLGNSRHWLLILEKTELTKTNEDRTNVIDPLYALFSGNDLLVKHIINPFVPTEQIDHLISKEHVYIKNNKVEITNYYKTPKAALFSSIDILNDHCFGLCETYTGDWPIFDHSSGSFISMYKIHKNMLMGKISHDNGEINVIDYGVFNYNVFPCNPIPLLFGLYVIMFAYITFINYC